MLNRWMQHCDTGGMSVTLTADGDPPALQFSMAAAEQCQNYGKSLFRWHEPFVSPAWPVSAAESRLKEEKDFQCYSVISALSYFPIFFTDPTVWGGYWDQRERDGDTHTPPAPSRVPQHPSEQPCLRLGASQAQWTGDIHAANDSSGSGTTERIEKRL